MNTTLGTQDQKLILVIDDDRSVRLLLRRVMEHEGYRVVDSADGEEGLAAFVQHEPAIVLVDGMMPIMDGFETCRQIKAMPRGEQTPILMITSLEDNASVDRAFEVGASDYVTKPIHWAVLRQRVRRLVRAREAEEVLRASEARHRSVVDTAFDAIITVSGDGRIQSFNRGAERTFGHTAAYAIGQSLQVLVPLHLHDEYHSAFAALLTGNTDMLGQTIEGVGQRADDTVFPLELVIARIQEEREVIFTGIVRDVTERKLFEAQLQHRAFHDPLTDLPNRVLFMDRLAQAVLRARREQRAVAVLFLDIDSFKFINDTLGHKAGDQLLVAVAHRLQSCIRGIDTVARMGGDEFTILLEEVSTVSSATYVAERIAEQMRTPFCIDGKDTSITTSVGIAFHTGHHEQPDDLLRSADVAMYEAKRAGKARFVVFDSSLDEHARERLTLETDLRLALEHDEFLLYYQPIVSVRSGQIGEFEALLRWQHPQRGLLAPGDFIALAEDTGLIIPVGRWVLREACRQMQAWHQQPRHGAPLVVAVNLSARQFRHATLLEDIAAILKETGLDPQFLKLEITESVVLDSVDSTLSTLRALKALGVQLAIDDFGTGYSSLNYLKQFPIDVIKIDRSFIQGLGETAQDTAMIAAMITLGHALGFQVLTEGVETSDQLAQLDTLQCDLAQGYLFARPLPAETVAEYLAHHCRQPISGP